MRRSTVVLVGILLCCLSAVLFFSIGTAEHAPWDCSECGRTGNVQNYCGGCAHPAPWMKEAFSTVGNIVRFGHYEQDNNPDNGQEEIEWIVLDAQEGKSLLLSKYGLDAKPYNDSRKEITWETCTLRSWLNKEFLGTAFSESEQSSILLTTVDNLTIVDESEAQGFSRYENDTQDQIFLLSDHEALDLYFQSSAARRCAPTDYAMEQGAHTTGSFKVDGRTVGLWWLRTPESYYGQINATFVTADGWHSCTYVDDTEKCVRPALWIYLESDIF